MAVPAPRLTSQVLKTRDEIVADALRAAILRGIFKPGEKLDQQELGRQSAPGT